MRKFVMVIAPFVMLACAQATQTSGDESVDVTRTRARDEGNLDVDVLSQRVAYAHSIMRSPDDVWNVMKDVYQRLGFPVSRFDPATRSIAADGFPVRRRLGGQSVSRYVDCGRTVAGPNADTYTVWLRVATTVVPLDSGSVSLKTEVSGSAADPSMGPGGASRVLCTSLGTLEERIATTAREALLGTE